MAKTARLTPDSSVVFMVSIRHFGWRNHIVRPRKKSFLLIAKSQVGWGLGSPQLRACFSSSQLTLWIASLSAPKPFQNPAKVSKRVTLPGNEAHPTRHCQHVQIKRAGIELNHLSISLPVLLFLSEQKGDLWIGAEDFTPKGIKDVIQRYCPISFQVKVPWKNGRIIKISMHVSFFP